MIIARAPLRIAIGGGASDVPAYYMDNGGFTLTASIDRYVYITIHETFVDDLIVKYSRVERVSHSSRVQHPIIRETMDMLKIEGKGLEISSMADIPAGTGLGSSSSFTVSLLRALHTWRGDVVDARQLAEEACAVEIDRLASPIGKQDQYIAAYGGLAGLTYTKEGIRVTPVTTISQDTRATLEDNLLMFFTGYIRKTSDIMPAFNITDMQAAKNLGYWSLAALEEGDLEKFATLLTSQWMAKRQRSPATTNSEIDNWFDVGLHNGALGGKLVGAGGGGFLLFYANDRGKLRTAMREQGLREVRFNFDTEGARTILQ